jgi:hypothetical protein
LILARLMAYGGATLQSTIQYHVAEMNNGALKGDIFRQHYHCWLAKIVSTIPSLTTSVIANVSLPTSLDIFHSPQTRLSPWHPSYITRAARPTPLGPCSTPGFQHSNSMLSTTVHGPTDTMADTLKNQINLKRISTRDYRASYHDDWAVGYGKCPPAINFGCAKRNLTFRFWYSSTWRTSGRCYPPCCCHAPYHHTSSSRSA